MKQEGKNSTFSGLIWSFAERFGAQLISFVVSLVLARILMPSDYGIIAIVLVFINVANAFVTGGFGNSLIQKKDADDLDFSTIFYFNIFFSLIIYLVIFFASPLIESFYELDGLTLVMRIIGIRLLFTGINSVQRAYIAKRMQFKKFFYATLAGTIISAIVGIWMAIKGYGVWALVAQYLINTIIDTVVLFVVIDWKPKFLFSFTRLKKLLSYGWKLLIAHVLSAIFVELNSLIIGKKYSKEDLAFYNRGKKFPQLFVTNIISAIETVLFPYMSNIQDKMELLKQKTKLSVKFGAFFIFPICLGLAACSKNVVLVLLGEKWIDAYPYILVFGIAFCVTPITMANIQAIKAIGKSGVYLILDIISKTLSITLLIVCMNFGVIWIAISEIISALLILFIDMIPNKKYLNYGIKEQIFDIIPTLFISVIMFISVYFIGHINVNCIVLLIIQILSGIIIYFSLAYIFRISALRQFFEFIKRFKNRKKEVLND